MARAARERSEQEPRSTWRDCSAARTSARPMAPVVLEFWATGDAKLINPRLAPAQRSKTGSTRLMGQVL